MMLQTIYFKMVILFIVCMLLSFASGQAGDTTEVTIIITNTTSGTGTTTSTIKNSTVSTNGSTKQQSIIMPISIIGSLFLSYFIGYT
jgi:hypothetical protein